MNDLELQIIFKSYNENHNNSGYRTLLSFYWFILDANLEDKISLYDLNRLYFLEHKSFLGDDAPFKINNNRLRQSFSVVATIDHHVTWKTTDNYFKLHPEVINMTLKQIKELNID